MGSYLDSILSGGTTGPAGPPGEQGAVPDALPVAIDLPDDGLRLFNDPSYGLSFKHADGRLRTVSPSNVRHVEQHLLPGEQLTTGTFEAALHAAIAYVEALPRNGAVLMPPGEWPMTSMLTMLGFGYVKPTALLIGASRDATRLLWPNAYTGICIKIDGYQGVTDGLATYGVFHGGLCDFSIHSNDDSGRGVGLYVCNALFTRFENLTVRGFGASRNNGIDEGVGIWLDGNRGTFHNLQHLHFTNVLVGGCTTGLRTRSATQCGFVQVQMNQNRFCDVLLDSANFFEWLGGMTQSSGHGDQPNNPYYTNPFYCVRTWGDERRTGTGAAMSAAVSGLVTVTGLTGVTTADVGRWFLVRGDADPRENGAFEIMEYVGSASFKIRKANGVGSTGRAWAVHGYPGGDIVSFVAKVYHEAASPIAAWARFGLSEDTGSEYKCESVLAWSLQWLIEADGGARVFVKDPVLSPTVGWVKAKNLTLLDISGVIDTPESAPTKFLLDSFTERNTIVHSPRGTFTATPGSRAIVSLLAPYASEVWDERSGVHFVGGEVSSWIGQVNGTDFACTPAGSLKRAVWTARNPDFGGHGTVGARAKTTGGHSLNAVLNVPVPIGARPGLLMVMSPPRGYLPGNWQARGPALTSADFTRRLGASYDDSNGANLIADFSMPEGNGGMTFAKPSGRPVMLLLQQTQDSTGAWGMVATEGDVSNTLGNSAFAAPLDKPLTHLQLSGSPQYFNYYVNDMDFALIAVLHKPLPYGVQQALFEVCKATWAEQMQASVLPAISASLTYAVESQLNTVQPVSLTSANVVIPLPAGHRRGDEMTIKVSTTASGHTCTLDPAGSETIDGASTLVLSTDYAWARVVSDGTNWMILGKG